MVVKMMMHTTMEGLTPLERRAISFCMPREYERGNEQFEMR